MRMILIREKALAATGAYELGLVANKLGLVV
jgi:hypothetical protein